MIFNHAVSIKLMRIKIIQAFQQENLERL